jgi:hypothetical protein
MQLSLANSSTVRRELLGTMGITKRSKTGTVNMTPKRSKIKISGIDITPKLSLPTLKGGSISPNVRALKISNPKLRHISVRVAS